MELDEEEGGSAKFGKFELVEQIGKGGMATVHRAILRGMGGFKREVVIKRILPDLAKDEHFVKMFIEEAKLSALLDHPNIVQVYDFGVIEGHYYLSMEFIDGLTLLKLRKAHRRRNPFPAEAAALIMHQVCLGLDYTHRLSRDGQPLGLVHRDVSPSNVMVSAHGEVKLLDFGIAKAVEAIDNEQTRTGTLKGKWSYMAPEQVVGAQVTFRSDIFACGIVLWEILSGRRLFKDKTDFLTLSNVANAKVPRLSSYRQDLEPIFDDICQRALAKKPEDRYGSAEEMAEHLWAYLSHHTCTSSALGAMVSPLLSEDTIQLQPEEILQEISGSNSNSFSASAAGSMPPSRESLTSLPAGEQEVLHDLQPGRRLIPLITGGFLLATLVIVGLLCMLRPAPKPDGGPVAANQPSRDTRSATTPSKTPAVVKAPAVKAPAVKAPPIKAAPIKAPAVKAPLAKAPAVKAPPVKAPPVKAPPVKAPPVAKAKPPPPPRPKPVEIRVTTSPPGATIRIVGEARPRGPAPVTLTLSSSNKAREVVASLPGHRPLRHRLVPNRSRQVALKLTPVPSRPRVVPRPKVVRRKPRPAVAKRKPEAKGRKHGKGDPVPNLKSGDLADPYGD